MKNNSSLASRPQRTNVIEFMQSLKYFTRGSIYDLAAIVEPDPYETGEIVFSQGDDTGPMYIVIEGRLKTFIMDKDGRQSEVREMGPGDLLGIIPLMAGGKRNATVMAMTRCCLAKIERNDLDSYLDKYPGIKQKLLKVVSYRLKRAHLAEVLPKYFDEMDEGTFDYIESLFEWVHVKRGDILYRKGDVGDSLYVLINGYLHVIDEERSEPNKVLAEMQRGEIVGEMALLSDEVRTASIHAARDCDLIKLSRTSFENISQKFPQVMMAITRVLVDRLKDVRSGKSPKRNTLCYVILPLTPNVPVAEFTRKLTDSFSNYGSSVLLNPVQLDRLLCKPGISTITGSDPRDSGLRACLADLEASHDYVIYQADSKFNAWTRRCLARADKIVLLADAYGSPEITRIEEQVRGKDDMTTTPRKVLVLLHPNGSKQPGGTAAWLDERCLRGHYHVRWDREADFGRLARILSNRAIGLVLGGGAAKGIAHIGVIKALEEKGIPIDMVGGASMGSIIGAHYAMGNDPDNMLALCKKLFIEINPFNEYTLPLVSLMRGKKLERMGKLAYGESYIEDLWLNYFCVSSNLTTSQIKVHQRGSLWKAVRTSSSIPGVISPVLEDGEIYVDGGVINNLPGDIMRRQCDSVIVVEVSPNLDLRAKVDKLPSPWKLLWLKLMPFKKTIKIPSIIDIMLSTVLTGSFIAANSVKSDADLSLTPPLSEIGFLDFKKMNKIAEIGYNYTREILEREENKNLLATLTNKK
jgi:NTE family protein/lysophospholipid hydrolase